MVEKKKEGIWLEGRLIAANDPHLQWWLKDGEGKDYERKFVIHLCATPSSGCRKTKRHREQEFHSDTYREISSGDIISKRVGWFKGDAETSDIDHEVAVLTGSPPVEPAAGDRRGPMGPSKLSWDEGVGRAMDMDEPPAGEDVKERLAELGARVGVGGTARDDKPKRGKTKVDEAPPTGEKPKEKAKKKTGKKKKAQDPHWFGRPVSESDEVVGSDEAGSEEQNDLADEGRTTGRKRKPTRKRGSRKLGKRMKGEDRGPFGVGHKVEFKDSDRSDDDDSGSSFHAGPSTKSRQLQLQEYSEQYPGRLAARLLQKMEEILARQEGPLSSKAERNLTPATATSYFLTVLLPQYKDRINLRTSREIRTLSKVLDLMAVGNVKTAGDVVAQRIKSLELFLADQVWGRAQHLELIPPEGVNLVGKDETLMATKEQVTDQKMKWAIAGYTPWRPLSKGKGDMEEKGKGKGKGKGKKGKKGNDHQETAPTA